jgi:L-ascorbate metabolism protein UlaG (beta-lactamase superfamily)
MKETVRITFISNAGVLADFGGKKILLDGLYNSKVPFYRNPPPGIKKQVMDGIPPFNNISLLLFTHEHCDHFEAISTAEFLKQKKNAYLIGNRKVIGEITRLDPDLDKKRCLLIEIAPGNSTYVYVNGINIKMISLLHEAKEYADVQNIAFLLEAAGKKVLHVGDAKPSAENFAPFQLADAGIDLLVAPFPFLSLPSARQVIEKYLKPKKIALVHLPHREDDRFGWINATKKSFERVKDDFFETVIFERFGEDLVI